MTYDVASIAAISAVLLLSMPVLHDWEVRLEQWVERRHKDD